MTDDTRPLGDQIAAAFVVRLKEFMTVEQWEEMRAKNASPAYGPDVCASHDYCDANEPMAESFLEVMRREIDLQSDDDLKLWGLAWTVAKASALTAPDLTGDAFAMMRDAMSDRYSAWMEAQGLTPGSADEVLMGDGLTAPQRRWLSQFVRAWEALDDAEREHGDRA